VKRQTLTFTAPRQVELREETLPSLGAEDVLVETLCSAISAGTELLVYRGQFPKELADSNDALSSGLKYPLAYGYACVGVIREAGRQADPSLRDKRVFAFQPHTSHFILPPSSLILLPECLTPEAACFLPNMETAVNLVQDAAPILGERALVLGQGVIGLLAASLLSEFPLEKLAVADHLELRRKALHVGRSTLNVQRFDSSVPDFRDQAKNFLANGADLTLELSGSPSALNDAIGLTAFSGRIVIGSWYGEKRAALDLGGAFHRSRLKLISSQVSTIAPELSGRWDKSRRFGVAWDAIQRVHPEQWITHRFPLRQAAEAYRLLDERPQEAIQVIFTVSS
jgi:2-desacetyl-2-hydroxyethyl bacteriochlorophyllide A dehydrogenase